MARLRNPRQERFSRLVAMRAEPAMAYQQAGYRTRSPARARALWRRPDVAMRIAEPGRALSERERGFRRAGAGAMAVREAMGFWDDEVRRLDELGAKIPPGKPGFHDLALKGHLARRTETIARLKEADPEQAALFDLRTRPLVETRARTSHTGHGLRGAVPPTGK